jgi:hypothetical protein
MRSVPNWLALKRKAQNKRKRNCNTFRLGSCFERLGAPLTVAFNSVDGYQAGVIKNLCGFSIESVKFESSLIPLRVRLFKKVALLVNVN